MGLSDKSSCDSQRGTGSVARDFHTEPHTILVVVNPDFADVLDQTARRALTPKTLATSAPVVRFTRFNRQSKGFFVHVGVHEELATRVVGCYDGNHPGGIEFRGEVAAFFNLFYGRAGLE